MASGHRYLCALDIFLRIKKLSFRIRRLKGVPTFIQSSKYFHSKIKLAEKHCRSDVSLLIILSRYGRYKD